MKSPIELKEHSILLNTNDQRRDNLTCKMLNVGIPNTDAPSHIQAGQVDKTCNMSRFVRK